jgi:hypothetical protein
MGEDAQQRIAAVQRERLTEAHDLGELIISKSERERSIR